MTQQESEDEQSQPPEAPGESQVPDNREARELMRKKNQVCRTSFAKRMMNSKMKLHALQICLDLLSRGRNRMRSSVHAYFENAANKSKQTARIRISISLQVCLLVCLWVCF